LSFWLPFEQNWIFTIHFIHFIEIVMVLFEINDWLIDWLIVFITIDKGLDSDVL